MNNYFKVKANLTKLSDEGLLEGFHAKQSSDPRSVNQKQMDDSEKQDEDMEDLFSDFNLTCEKDELLNISVQSVYDDAINPYEFPRANSKDHDMPDIPISLPVRLIQLDGPTIS